MDLVKVGNWRWEMASRGCPCWGWWQGNPVVGQIFHPVVKGTRQVEATVGIQGAEKAMTPNMTPFLGRSWGMELRGEERTGEGAAWRSEKLG